MLSSLSDFITPFIIFFLDKNKLAKRIIIIIIVINYPSALSVSCPPQPLVPFCCLPAFRNFKEWVCMLACIVPVCIYSYFSYSSSLLCVEDSVPSPRTEPGCLSGLSAHWHFITDVQKMKQFFDLSGRPTRWLNPSLWFEAIGGRGRGDSDSKIPLLERKSDQENLFIANLRMLRCVNKLRWASLSSFST